MHALMLSARAARHGFAGSLLLLALQRSPALRWIATAMDQLAGARCVEVLRLSSVLAASLGAIDTVAGATQYVQTPSNPVSGTVGQPLSVTFTLTGSETPVRSFRVTGSLPPGLSMDGLTNGIVNNANPVISGSPTQSGSYTLQVMGYDQLNGVGHTDRVNYPITLNIAAAAATAPVITVQPASVTATTGAAVTLSVTATGTAPLSYQWYRNGTAVGGATTASLAFQNLQLSNAGNYTVTVGNGGGNVTSRESYVTVESPATAASDAKLANLSVRLPLSLGQTAIAGFVVSGTAPRKFLLRAIGPGLAQYGVSGTLANPMLELYNGAVKIHQSDDWDATLAAAAAATGAFPLTADSRDAALAVTLQPGSYTVQVRGAGGEAGEVLVEVYEVPAR